MEIHSLALFGSTARNELLPDRDIDLLVNLEPPYTFDACQKIQRFIPNIDYKQFIQDDRTYD
jgi:predicted nucleotidyltransferase